MAQSSRRKLLPGYQEHVQLLCTQAAALLDPGYRKAVQEVLKELPTAPLERALAATVGLAMPQAGTARLVETAHVVPFIPMLTEQRAATDRILAVREAVGAPAEGLMGDFEREELRLPAAITTAAEARSFARSHYIGAVVTSSSPLLHLYAQQDGSIAISSPLVAIVAARMGKTTAAVAACALALGCAHRVLMLGTDLEGHPWYEASAQCATEGVVHALTGWLAQLALHGSSHAPELEAWASTTLVLRDYVSARPLVSDEQQLGRHRVMPAERLRGLIIRLRRVNEHPVTLDMLLKMERRGSHPLYPPTWSRPPLPLPPLRAEAEGTHTPSPSFRINERALLRRIAILLDRRDLDLAGTGRLELDEAAEALVVHANRAVQELLDQSRQPQTRPDPFDRLRKEFEEALGGFGKSEEWPTARSKRFEITQADGTPRPRKWGEWIVKTKQEPQAAEPLSEPPVTAAEAHAGKKGALMIWIMGHLDLFKQETALLAARDEVATEKLLMDPGATDAEAEARLIANDALRADRLLASEVPASEEAPRGPLLLPPGEPPASEGGSDPDA